MKRKIFNNLTELNSQKVYERSPKTRHNINYLDNSYSGRKFKSNEKPKNREYNNVYKNNSNSKKGKMGKLEYELEPRNILLIPDNFNVKNNNIKICEKELSQKEKNYFISETNFQLIKDALNEKENYINQLQLTIQQNDDKISLLEEENKKLEEVNNELILQIQKNDIYFNKIYKLLEYIFNFYNSYKEPEIKKFIKEQNLEFLLNNMSGLQKNQKKEYYENNNKNNEDKDYINEKNYLSKLFDINQDEIMKGLEKTKKMYNDLRKQLNDITNIKSKDNENQNDINKQLLEYQKKLNELNLENQKYMKENTYLKLLCKNLQLEKKVDNIDDNNNEIIQELEKQLEEEKNKNANLIKENEILKNKNESLIKSMNILKLDSNKINQENKLINSEFEKIKIEKENLEKQINDRNLKNKNGIYSRKMNLETNKINKSNWKRLKIEQGDKILYVSDKNDEIYNKSKTNFDDNDEQNFDDNNNNNLKYMINFDGENIFNEQMNNVDLLMILYNKSKQTEAFLKNK